jgi:hypothetical protein
MRKPHGRLNPAFNDPGSGELGFAAACLASAKRFARHPIFEERSEA